MFDSGAGAGRLFVRVVAGEDGMFEVVDAFAVVVVAAVLAEAEGLGFERFFGFEMSRGLGSVFSLSETTTPSLGQSQYEVVFLEEQSED